MGTGVVEVDYLGIIEDILDWFIGHTHHSSGKSQCGDLRNISTPTDFASVHHKVG